MKKIPCHLIVSTLLITLAAGHSWARSSDSFKSDFNRDKTLEENLRWQASEDRAITPTRVIRWLRGVRGAAVFAAVTPAEFQPIVNVENTRVRAVATIAFKF